MKTNWYAIDPTLTKEGAFAAFSNFENSKELKPIPVEEVPDFYDKADFIIKQDFVSSNIEAKIAYSSFFKGTLDAENKLFVYDFSYFKEVTVEEPIGNLITGTRHGATIRVGINLRNMKIDVSADFLAISAAVALGKVEASYKIEGKGFGNALKIIVPELPTSGKFDFDAYSKIADIGPKIIGWTDKNRNQLGISPIQVAIVIPLEDLLESSAQSIYYAMSSIKKGVKLEDALKFKAPHLKTDTIKDTYKKITRRDDPKYDPQKYEINLADKWLEFKDVLP